MAQLDWLAGPQQVPLFRPWDGDSDDPNAHACYPLLPWSNRISSGGIEFDGKFWPLDRNLQGEPFPIHGDGWQGSWSVVEYGSGRLRVALESSGQPPYRYRGQLTYEVDGPTLVMCLAVEHRGAVPAPYGLGFHPWLPRRPGTSLQAAAATIWQETADHLPAGAIAVADRPEWDFASARPLPTGWVNNAFEGWNGIAVVAWPEHGLNFEITADPPLSTYILFSSSADADFFCFEPVSHPVDAFHLAGMPGLKMLALGERLTATCRFTVRERSP